MKKLCRLKKLIILIFCFNLFVLSSRAQEMLGIVNSNYAGINSALINPSLMADSKLYLDISLVTAGVFCQSNYLYISKSDYSLPRLFNGNLPSHNGKIFYDIYNQKNKNISGDIRLNLPSAMISIGRHSFGIYEGFRVGLSVRDIPYQAAKFIYYGLGFRFQQKKTYDIGKIKAAELMWSEIALCYAYNLVNDKMNFLSGGISLKTDLGISGFYLNTKGGQYNVPNDTTLNLSKVSGEYGYSNSHIFNAKSFSFDLGVTYERKPTESSMQFKKLCQQRYKDYIFRIGASILDIGSMNFKKNATNYTINNVTSDWNNVNRVSSFDAFGNDIKSKFSGDYTTSNSFKIATPKAISVQFDYHYRKYWFFNSTIVQGINIGEAYVRRPSQISFTPRYERRWFEVAFPLSLYEDRYPRWGLSVRILNLTIGTEKFGSLIDLNDFTGLDLYFSLKINFAKGNCGRTGVWKNFKAKFQKFYKCRHF